MLALAAGISLYGPFVGSTLEFGNNLVSAEAASRTSLRLPGSVEVPQLVGLPADAALEALQNAGLEAQSQTQPSDRPANEVLTQDPIPGTMVAPGTAVALVLVPWIFDYYTKLGFSPAHKIHKIHALRMVSASSALSSLF